MMAAPTFHDFVAGDWKTTCYDRCKPSTRGRMAKLEGSLEGFLAGRRDRNAA